MRAWRAHLYIRGLVQGVGFRPYVYSLATSKGLCGFVSNLADAGVEVVVEGDEDAIKEFIEELPQKKPSVSRIDEVEVRWEEPGNAFSGFTISESQERRISVRSVIPVDLGICDLCVTEITGSSRFTGYPFTTCAQCGPRFTMIRRLPYDRVNTSMDAFPFCPECLREYLDPKNRRYDAQGFACPKCGPKLTLLDASGNTISSEDPIGLAAELLSEGSVIAIKGLGGFHLSADAFDESSVAELRRRRRRPSQPFAIMSPSIEAIERFAEVSQDEAELLASPARPIVVLDKSENCSLADSVSPGLQSVGVMLPYTGIHLLLLRSFRKEALVMTSANYPGKPMIIDERSALSELKGVADYYLVHNREIVNRCDDSVIKSDGGDKVFLRRSRGYSPSYLRAGWSVGDKYILSLGGELNNNASLFVKDQIITTQHVGDVDELETLDFMKNAIRFIEKTYDLKKPDLIVCDMNPSFLTARYAEELSSDLESPLVRVQHHHAHAAALMVENSIGLGEETVSIVIDGTGYGLDGNSWGGEIFVAGYSDFKRLAHLEPHPLPGGDICAYYPARVLASILSSTRSDSEIERLLTKNASKYFKHGIEELRIVLKQCRDARALKTTSLGRLLDAIAVALDVCYARTYEGEPPMRLESLALGSGPSEIPLELGYRRENGVYVFDTSSLVDSVVDIKEAFDKKDIAFAVHRSIGRALGEVACLLAGEYGIGTIGLTGGAAVNTLIRRYIKEKVLENNKKFIVNKNYPCGDGCVSVGQSVVASSRIL
ncbi:MAG: carbamoyltransferase HypF [Candidatus Methanosuratincola sp.]